MLGPVEWASVCVPPVRACLPSQPSYPHEGRPQLPRRNRLTAPSRHIFGTASGTLDTRSQELHGEVERIAALDSGRPMQNGRVPARRSIAGRASQAGTRRLAAGVTCHQDVYLPGLSEQEPCTRSCFAASLLLFVLTFAPHPQPLVWMGLLRPWSLASNSTLSFATAPSPAGTHPSFPSAPTQPKFCYSQHDPRIVSWPTHLYHMCNHYRRPPHLNPRRPRAFPNQRGGPRLGHVRSFPHLRATSPATWWLTRVAPACPKRRNKDLAGARPWSGVHRSMRVEILTNDQGNRITPSYVGFASGSGERFVGDAAKNQAPQNPTKIVFDAKTPDYVGLAPEGRANGRWASE